VFFPRIRKRQVSQIPFSHSSDPIAKLHREGVLYRFIFVFEIDAQLIIDAQNRINQPSSIHETVHYVFLSLFSYRLCIQLLLLYPSCFVQEANESL
jgi:hypothetical protein